MTNASGLAPTEIHITNASGELIKNGFRDRKAARAAARKLSRGGAVVYLVDATEGAKPIIEYRAGYQAGRTAPPHRGTASRRLAPERPPASVETLPDRLRPGLALVFVGLNPAEYSARVGHYYSKPGNVFWEKLSASGLVTGNLRCEDDHRLPAEFGIGLTDVVKRVVTDSAKVSRAEIRDAWPDFKERIAAVAPRMVCFNGAKAFGIMFPRVREIIAQTDMQFRAALARYASRADQSWSLTDCASFLVMEQRHIAEALAYDRDFEQAGFVALLRESGE